LEIFDDSAWQMSRGERAALEGILTQCRPQIAIEIGASEGGSLERIARHAGAVHSFDYVAPQLPGESPPNVTFHTGDPDELLPAALEELAGAGRNVDFALVDGDGSPDGARRSIEALLDSPAVGRTVILIAQTTNERVRRGVDAVRFAAWPKVAHVEPDFVPGYMLADEPVRHELAGGLGLVLVDAARLRYGAGPVTDQRTYPAAKLLAEVRDAVTAREAIKGPLAPYRGIPIDHDQTRTIDRLRHELAEVDHEVQRLRAVATHHEDLWRSLMDSLSWRLTAPLRAAVNRVRGGTGGR
jgi:hypothetical protein